MFLLCWFIIRFMAVVEMSLSSPLLYGSAYGKKVVEIALHLFFLFEKVFLHFLYFTVKWVLFHSAFSSTVYAFWVIAK